MPQTPVEFLTIASKILPDFFGNADDLQGFLAALELVNSINDGNDIVAINLIKTKLKGTAINLISGSETTVPEVVQKLKTTVKGESVDVITAKLMNVRQSSKPANAYATEVEELTKKLQSAYISDGLTPQLAETYSTKAAIKAMIKNSNNDKVKLIMESGQFNNMNEAVAKFVNCCTEAYGQPNAILHLRNNRDRKNYYNNNRNNNFRGRGESRGRRRGNYNNRYNRNYYNQQRNSNEIANNNNRNVRIAQQVTENEPTPSTH